MDSSTLAILRARALVWELVLAFAYSAAFMVYVNAALNPSLAEQAVRLDSKPFAATIFAGAAGAVAAFIAAFLWLAQKQRITAGDKLPPATRTELTIKPGLLGTVPLGLNILLVGIEYCTIGDRSWGATQWHMALPGITLITIATVAWWSQIWHRPQSAAGTAATEPKPHSASSANVTFEVTGVARAGSVDLDSPVGPDTNLTVKVHLTEVRFE